MQTISLLTNKTASTELELLASAHQHIVSDSKFPKPFYYGLQGYDFSTASPLKLIRFQCQSVCWRKGGAGDDEDSCRHGRAGEEFREIKGTWREREPFSCSNRDGISGNRNICLYLLEPGDVRALVSCLRLQFCAFIYVRNWTSGMFSRPALLCSLLSVSPRLLLITTKREMGMHEVGQLLQRVHSELFTNIWGSERYVQIVVMLSL